MTCTWARGMAWWVSLLVLKLSWLFFLWKELLSFSHLCHKSAKKYTITSSVKHHVDGCISKSIKSQRGKKANIFHRRRTCMFCGVLNSRLKLGGTANPAFSINSSVMISTNLSAIVFLHNLVICHPLQICRRQWSSEEKWRTCKKSL